MGYGKRSPDCLVHDQKMGKVFYKALGRSSITFKHENFQQLITNVIRWIGNF